MGSCFFGPSAVYLVVKLNRFKLIHQFLVCSADSPRYNSANSKPNSYFCFTVLRINLPNKKPHKFKFSLVVDCFVDCIPNTTFSF